MYYVRLVLALVLAAMMWKAPDYLPHAGRTLWITFAWCMACTFLYAMASWRYARCMAVAQLMLGVPAMAFLSLSFWLYPTAGYDFYAAGGAVAAGLAGLWLLEPEKT